ncbi:MAG: hypothetical protein IJ017_00650 [Oscillospiraceae bacterium]|nr:hypothetical protein [Oscillospiraceae bacterium]
MAKFLIGDVLLEIDYSSMPVEGGENLDKFSYNAVWHGEKLTLQTEFKELDFSGAELKVGDNRVCEVYKVGNENMLVYHWGNLFRGFAVWPERFAVTYSPEMRGQPALREDWFFSIISFHRQMLLRGGCVFHASYIDIGDKAVLFTAPSNTGKSTQADLWCRFADAEVINGDRVLLKQKNGVWCAYGYPSCGTSGICQNRTLPVAAIVVLEQGQENKIVQLTAAQKIRALVSATEVYLWDQTEIDKAFEIAGNIIADVPVIKLSCRPDEDAVRVLQSFLEESIDV